MQKNNNRTSKENRAMGIAIALLLVFVFSGVTAYLVHTRLNSEAVVRYALITCGTSGVILLLLLIIAGTARSSRRNRYYSKSLEQVDQMTGIEFERFLRAHFLSLGYKVEETPESGDYGVDLVLRKNGETIGVQAKKKQGGRIGIEAVYQVVGGLAYYNADRGMVVTNQYYTRQAKNLAEVNNVELWDRQTIQRKFPRLADVEKMKKGGR